MKDLEKERQRILEMVGAGKLTAQEAVKLLEALEEHQEKTAEPSKGRQPRWLRIYVKDDEEEINIKIPWRLVAWMLKFSSLGLRFVPTRAREVMEEQGISADQVREILSHLDQSFQDLEAEGLAGEELIRVEGEDEEVRIWLE